MNADSFKIAVGIEGLWTLNTCTRKIRKYQAIPIFMKQFSYPSESIPFIMTVGYHMVEIYSLLPNNRNMWLSVLQNRRKPLYVTFDTSSIVHLS